MAFSKTADFIFNLISHCESFIYLLLCFLVISDEKMNQTIRIQQVPQKHPWLLIIEQMNNKASRYKQTKRSDLKLLKNLPKTMI
jgi:hypothetical protein